MNARLDKKAKSVVAVYVILLATYILSFLIIPFQKGTASWICFGATMIAFGCSFYVCKLAFDKKETLVSRIYGYPVFRIGVLYALIQLILGIMICIIGTFVTVPYWLALLVAVVLLGAAMIGVIVTDNTRDMLEELDERMESETENVTFFQIDIAGIVDMCEQGDVKEALEKLNELFLYSDPVTNDATKGLESAIETMLAELKGLVAGGKSDESKVLIKNITNTLKERNRICMAKKV